MLKVMTNHTEGRKTVQHLAESWGAALAATAERFTGTPLQLELTTLDELHCTPQLLTRETDLIWVAQAFEKVPGLSVMVGAAAGVWQQLAIHLQGKPSPAALGSIDNYGELMAPTFEKLAEQVSARSGIEILCQGTAISCSRPPADFGYCAAFSIHLSSVTSQIFLAISFDAIGLTAEATEERGSNALARGEGLARFFGLELTLRAVVGRTKIRLSEALRLVPGSVVVLGGSGEHVVELIANDTVIVLGKPVLVDGNYAVRVATVEAVRVGPHGKLFGLGQWPEGITHL